MWGLAGPRGTDLTTPRANQVLELGNQPRNMHLKCKPANENPHLLTFCYWGPTLWATIHLYQSSQSQVSDN